MGEVKTGVEEMVTELVDGWMGKCLWSYVAMQEHLGNREISAVD